MRLETSRHSIWSSGLWAFLAAIGMLVWIAFGNRAEDAAASTSRPGSVIGAASLAEAEATARLLTEAKGILRSPKFRQNLLALDRRYPAIYARPSVQAADVAQVARIVSLEQPFAHFAPAEAAVVDDLGSALGSAGEGAVTGRYSDIVIGRSVLRDYGSTDAVTRSCAINVAAHEYAHTISLTPMGYRPAFTDTRSRESRIPGRRDRSTPVASYLIGATAQCTWLQQLGRIGRVDVPACVEVFGSAAFNWDRCEQFAGGEPVALRPGLAPAADPL